jgi:hypothetical protein
MAQAQISTARASYSEDEGRAGGCRQIGRPASGFADRFELTFLIKLLWRNVRLTTAQTFTKMCLLFPAHPKDVRDTKVGDLKGRTDELIVQPRKITFPLRLTLTCPLPSNSKFSGLISRCATPIECKYSTPFKICLKQHSTSPTLMLPFLMAA